MKLDMKQILAKAAANQMKHKFEGMKREMKQPQKAQPDRQDSVESESELEEDQVDQVEQIEPVEQ